MDVLKPELVWVGGRCYRVNTLKDSDNDAGHQRQTNEYVEEGRLKNRKRSEVFTQFFLLNYLIFTDLYGDADNDDYIIEEFGSNQYRAKFHVAQ